MLAIDAFHASLPYHDFLTRFGQPADLDRWEKSRTNVPLTDEQTALLKSFVRTANVLVLAGAWCGDCANNCPILERFGEIAPVLKVRYLDRDAHPEVQAELRICGGDRVPVVVFFSEDGFEVGRFGERTLADYRRMLAASVPQLSGGAKPVSAEIHRPAVVADWLREVERIQAILRLSPRLRRLHAD